MSKEVSEFQVHYFVKDKGIFISAEKSIIDPNMDETLRVLPMMSGEDSLYISKGGSLHIDIEKESYGFYLCILSYTRFTKESSYEEAVEFVKNIEDALEDPTKYGFHEHDKIY